jgi:hypothetical protein
MPVHNVPMTIFSIVRNTCTFIIAFTRTKPIARLFFAFYEKCPSFDLPEATQPSFFEDR